MKTKRLLLIVGTLVFGVGLTSCSVIFGCHNPTGYCGDNVPDRDRIGGPSWFLITTPQKRMSYYMDRCLEAGAEDPAACALTRIKQNAHQYCVLYNLPPIRPKDDAEEASRQRNYAQCKQGVLTQHDL